jgi:uncharacterized protein YjbI with pentapeptide repeats
MDGATFDRELHAGLMQTAANLSMEKASFNDVNLYGARVTGDVFMNGATFDGYVHASALQVGGHLSMAWTDQKASFKEGMSLYSANVMGSISMGGATFTGELNANSLQVGSNLFMASFGQSYDPINRKASFEAVSLIGAKVAGNVEFDGATFGGDLNADSIQVGGHLFMRSTDQNRASFKFVNLAGANVARNVLMEGAIGTDQIRMVFARIGGNLDIRAASLAELNLSGASIAGDLSLGRFETPNTPTRWLTTDGKPGKLILRNTRVGNLMDAHDAWPIKGYLHLDGFTFARLGGFVGETGTEMRARGMRWWDDWIRRDPDYSSTPYEQLTAALIFAGDRAGADEMRFLARVRQRETERNWWSWVFSGFLQYVAGFGIGTYTFRVLYWVIGISVVGALYLCKCVPAAYQRGPIWCFGATLSRLLPVIEINKEFTDFFNDPGRTRLTSWQSFVFSVIGIVGWVLGAILIAAVAGLTQKP